MMAKLFHTGGASLVTLSVVLLTATSYSGVTTAKNVGFVNISLIMQQAPQARSAKNQLEEEFSEKDDELARLEERVDKLKEKFRKSGRKMKKDDREELKDKITQAQRKFKSRRDEVRESFSIRRREELTKLRDLIYEVVVNLAKKKKLDLVVSEPVLYASDKVNLTEEVLEILKKRSK